MMSYHICLKNILNFASSILKKVYLPLISAVAVYIYFSSITMIPCTTEHEQVKNTSKIECITPVYDYKGASHDNPELIYYIRKELMHPPSSLPYNLNNPEKVHFSQTGQSMTAYMKFFQGVRDGFFIEAGAVDGELYSNTLFFERELGWRGLLIEPFPDMYAKLLAKNRKAHSINVALATSTKASEEMFNFEGKKGVRSSFANVEKESGVAVKSIPLYSLLLALNVTVIDFMSLDIESFEEKVLRTIPWDKVKFRVMCIEVVHIPEGQSSLTEFMVSKGYKFLFKKRIDAWYGLPELLNITSVA